MIAATKGFVRKAGLILAVSLPLISTQAHAATVTVGGTSYEIINYGAFNQVIAEAQPWWGRPGRALEFANALGSAGIPWASNQATFGYEFGGFLLNYVQVTGSNVNPGGAPYFVVADNVRAVALASSVPEINAGSLSQALLILFALWLVTWRRTGSRVA